MRKTVAAVAALAVLTFASVANAAVLVRTYTLDTTEVAGFNSEFPSGNFGTVTVTDNGVDLYISVALADGLEFRNSPDNQHNDLTFDLKNNGVQDNTRTLSNFTDNVTPHVFFQAVGNSFNNQPFSGFNYAVDCTAGSKHSAGCTTGWNPTHNPTTMGFKVAGVSINEIASVPYTPPNSHTAKNIFFAVDVVNRFGNTGAIGATWNGFTYSYAPEPGAWALLILGFGCIGADLRRRRKAALAA